MAAIFSARLKISPLPREKGLGLIFFASVADAMQATVELLDLKPVQLNQTKPTPAGERLPPTWALIVLVSGTPEISGLAPE